MNTHNTHHGWKSGADEVQARRFVQQLKHLNLDGRL